MNAVQRISRWFARAVGDAGDARTIDALFPGSRGAGAPRMGSAELLKGYSRFPWLRAIVGKVSGGVASVPWGLWRDPGPDGRGRMRRDLRNSRDPIERLRVYNRARVLARARAAGVRKSLTTEHLIEVESSPALDLLDHGNSKMSGHTVIALLQQHLDLTGEAFAALDMNGLNLPLDMWPLPPTWITDMPSTGRTSFLVSGESWGTREVPAEHMFHAYVPDVADPYGRGSGIALTLGDELETDEYAARHMKQWFYNRARPDVLITAEGLREPEMDRLERAWLSKLKGIASKPHFINRNVKVDVISQSFESMQLSQIRKDERDIVLHVYGLPPEIFGIVEHSNRSTIDVADYILAKHVLTPRLEFLRMALQTQIIDRFDPTLILDYVSPIEEDAAYNLDVMKANPGVFRVDEWREQAGKAPLDTPEGDGYMVPHSVTFVSSLAEMATPEPEPVTPAPPLAPGDEPYIDDPDEDPPAPSERANGWHRRPVN